MDVQFGNISVELNEKETKEVVATAVKAALKEKGVPFDDSVVPTVEFNIDATKDRYDNDSGPCFRSAQVKFSLKLTPPGPVKRG